MNEILSQIRKIRREIYSLINKNNSIINDENVINLSQKLDELVIAYTENEYLNNF